MAKITLTALVAATSLVMACSNKAGPSQEPQVSLSIGEFTPEARTHFDGMLLDLGSGGRLGLIDIQSSAAEPDRLYAETIMLQRPPARSPFDATSQVVEIDCRMHRHRVIANLSYRRDGTLQNTLPVQTSFTDFAAYQRVYDRICDGSYVRDPVAEFASIAEFLDLFDTAEPTSEAGQTDGVKGFPR